MKQFRRIGFATALFFATSLLIAAFILLFNYSGCSPNNKSFDNISKKSLVLNELISGLKSLQKKYLTSC